MNRQAPKILVRSPNWVGDAIMATPVPVALKQSLPDCQVHVLARAWVAPLWEHHPEVDRIIPIPPKSNLTPDVSRNFWRSLQAEHYDLGLVLPNSFSAAWMAWRAKCRWRIGYSGDLRSWLLNQSVAWDTAAQQLPRPQAYLRLAQAAGTDARFDPKENFVVNVSDSELAHAEVLLGAAGGSSAWVGLAPGSVAASRRWPTQRYADLADRLAQAGYRVVLLGSASDAVLAEQVIEQSQTKPFSLAGKTKLREMLAVVKQLKLLVSNDSGAMHIAYSQGVPVLVLQGAADARITGPFGNHSHVLRDRSLACAPCVRNECRWKDLRCMLRLSVEQVWDEVQSLLGTDDGQTHARKKH